MTIIDEHLLDFISGYLNYGMRWTRLVFPASVLTQSYFLVGNKDIKVAISSGGEHSIIVPNNDFGPRLPLQLPRMDVRSANGT